MHSYSEYCAANCRSNLNDIPGAILFEGFLVEEGIEFQNIVQSFNPELSSEYRGTSPRRQIPGTDVSEKERREGRERERRKKTLGDALVDFLL